MPLFDTVLSVVLAILRVLAVLRILLILGILLVLLVVLGIILLCGIASVVLIVLHVFSPLQFKHCKYSMLLHSKKYTAYDTCLLQKNMVK